MTIATVEEIKRLGNIKDSDNISTDDFTAAIKAGDGEVYALTGKNDWNSTDDPIYFGKLFNIANLYATYTFLISFDKEEYLDKAKEVREAFEAAIEGWRKILLPEEDANTDSFAVESSEYTAYPMNPNAPIFMSDY